MFSLFQREAKIAQSGRQDVEGLGGVPYPVFARPGPWAVAGTRAGILRNRQPLVALRAPSPLSPLATSFPLPKGFRFLSQRKFY